MREKKAGNRDNIAAGWRKICAGFLLVGIGLLAGCGSMAAKPATTNSAGKYPEKPITVIVPFSAGGALDIIARALEKRSSKYLGQSLIVVNKPGAAGSIGLNELAGASPDGYTIGITSPEIILNPLYGPTKYNYTTALAPIAQVSTASMVIVTRADQPWRNLTDLVQYAKLHPSELKFGNTGIGSIPHIIGETFAQAADISIEHVPFRGASETTAALLGGHIQVLIVNPMSVSDYIKAGKIRGLAVTGEHIVDPNFDQIPTLKEVGYDIVLSNWYGVAVPKEVPPEIKAKIADGFQKIIQDPEFKQDIEKLGLPIVYLNPHDTEAVWLADQQKYTRIIQETGILDKIKEQKK